MDIRNLSKKAQTHLQVLCAEIGERRVGSEANRKATAYAEEVLISNNWKTEATALSVTDWQTEGAELICENKTFDLLSSHYSLGCSAKGKLLAINTISQLENTDIRDKILLLHGEIASKQIAPKNFPFWNPEEHQHLISLLEKGRPKALICATKRNPCTAGGVYPFPLFEDGDFDIPSVYTKDTVGEELLRYTGENVKLNSRAKRIPATAFNVIARKSGESRTSDDSKEKRIVISAHIDTKIDTPGAIDNGTGVTILLLLAELLRDYSGPLPVELVLFNGEDYYGAPGQLKYIEQNSGKFDNILLNINVDGAGYKEGPSCFSPFGLPEQILDALLEILWENPGVKEGIPWYQGDHSLFLQQDRPAIAVSSQWFIENIETQQITHTPKDNLSIVDPQKVAECTIALTHLLHRILSTASTAASNG